MNPLEEAAAYQQLLDEFGVTHDELAARIGRSRPLISNMIRLLRLPIAVLGHELSEFVVIGSGLRMLYA